MRILVVDDHPMVRHGIRRVLEQHFKNAEIAEAGRARDALAETRTAAYDLVTLDLSMPGEGGFELLQALRAAQPRLKILVITFHAAKQFARRALNAGALGFITKDAGPAELIRAATEVLKGRPHVNSGDDDNIDPASAGDQAILPHETLSDREYQVLRLLGSGRTVSQIAVDLALSAKTVSTYRTRVLTKLKLTHTADLIRYAIEHGLTDV